MSNRYSVGQMNQLGDGLEAADYSIDEVTKLRDPATLAQIKLILMGIAVIVRSSFKLVLDKAFNPSEFIGQGWAFWKGSVNGNGLEGDDACVQEPDIVDFEHIVLETHLKKGESAIHGEEKMKRARVSKNHQLGSKALLALWNDYQTKKAEGKSGDSILEMLRKSGKIGTVIYFFGSVLRDPNGDLSVLSLAFSNGEWSWYYSWLDDDWIAANPSASLASVN